MTSDNKTRLNKFLALQLGISRRQADNLIGEGKVTLNGQVAILGSQHGPGDNITVNDVPISDQASKYIYLALHKPVGYVCSRRRQGETPTVFELLPPEYQSLKTVGRLDRDSSGIILFTNDGDFTQRMTHPSFHKTKIYQVELDKPLAPLHMQMISDYGVQLEDGTSQFMVTSMNDEHAPHSDSHIPIVNRYEVQMTEGRNRQIRRTFASLGYKVTRLHRTQFGNYIINGMNKGEYKLVDIS